MRFGFAIIGGDLFGGISAGVAALPLCLGLGVLSGLGPEAGLYGAIALGILASLLGGAALLPQACRLTVRCISVSSSPYFC